MTEIVVEHQHLDPSPEASRVSGICEDARRQGSRGRLRVPARQQACDLLRDPSDVGGDHRYSASQRFENRRRKRVCPRRMEINIGRPVVRGDLRDVLLVGTVDDIDLLYPFLDAWLRAKKNEADV
jgi:hypothetical protein